MKIMVIGANGNLGRKVTRQALNRGHEVTAVLYEGETPDPQAVVLKRSLFDLTAQDIAEEDVIISTYGSGFKADPAVNKRAFLKYIELADGTDKHMIVIGGAGSLFMDSTHSFYEYESENHPEFLKGISMNIKMGIDELKKTKHMNWTVVCPSRNFDLEGPFTGDYLVGTEGEIIYNEQNCSYVTYEDLACAMIDIAENNSYQKMQITVATRRIG